jgi:hypothetical protein
MSKLTKYYQAQHNDCQGLFAISNNNYWCAAQKSAKIAGLRLL